MFGIDPGTPRIMNKLSLDESERSNISHLFSESIIHQTHRCTLIKIEFDVVILGSFEHCGGRA